jgi:hypothetical protein
MSNAKTRVGHGKIDASRTKGRGALGLTNKDKLALARSGTKDLLEGTRQANRKKARKKVARGQKPFLPVD